MKCETCGKIFNDSIEHICVPSKKIMYEPKPNFEKPHFIRQPQAASYDVSVSPISPNPPKGVSYQELMSHKNESLGILKQFKNIFSIWKRTFKNPSKDNIVLLIFGMLMFVIWIWTKFVSANYSYIMPDGIQGIAAVLFASFNNVPSRVLHFSALVTLFSAYLPAILSGNSKKLTGNIKTTIVLIRKTVNLKNGKRTSVFIMAFGIGIFMSNYLMRNNSNNKYAVCFTLGLTLLLSTSGLFKSTFVKLISGLYHDVIRLLKLHTPGTKYKLVIQLGLGLALISSYIICIIRGMVYSPITDNLGYILGVIILLVGLVHLIMTPKKVGSSHD